MGRRLDWPALPVLLAVQPVDDVPLLIALLMKIDAVTREGPA